MITLTQRARQQMESASLEDLLHLDRRIAAAEQTLSAMKRQRSDLFEQVLRQRLDHESLRRREQQPFARDAAEAEAAAADAAECDGPRSV